VAVLSGDVRRKIARSPEAYRDALRPTLAIESPLTTNTTMVQPMTSISTQLSRDLLSQSLLRSSAIWPTSRANSTFRQEPRLLKL
jgi:hypothetical protein